MGILTSLAWPYGWYVPEGRYVRVDYLLAKRREGDLRAGDVWDSKEGFEDGPGIQLGPVDCESGFSGKRNFLRMHRGQGRTIRRRAERAGYNLNPDNPQEYLRYLIYSSSLLACLSTDDEIREHCEVEDVVLHPRSGHMDSPDIVITHPPDCILGDHTNIFITDQNRIRLVPSTSTAFNLRINQWTREQISDFDRWGRTLFLRYWNRRVNAVRRKLREAADHAQKILRARKAAKRARKARLRANRKEAIKQANARRRTRDISARMELVDRAHRAVSEWQSHRVPPNRTSAFPHIDFLDQMCIHQVATTRQWGRGQGDNRAPISKAEKEGRIEIPRRYNSFYHLISVAELDLKSLKDHFVRMTEVQARHLRETDKISSSRQMIEHSSQECRRLRGEVGTTIAAISVLRDRAQDAERAIRRYERDIDDDALKYVGGILSSLERDSERLAEEEEIVTTFDNIQLGRFRELRHEAEIAVGNLKLPDDYWWNEEIERGPDLQRRARECDAHAQRVVAAIEEARGDWEGRLSQAQEYLTGRDGHNELLLRFRESTDRAREIFDENDDRLFGTVRGLIPGGGFGFIMQRVGEDLFFSTNDIIGETVSGGDRVRYAVVHARARNRAVRVQRIPPWVPPWRN